MPSTCAVIDCSNGLKQKHERERNEPGNPLIFHRFPVKHKLVCKVWIDKCKRDFKGSSVNSAAVCSDHFTVDDYERDLRNELLGLKTRKVLKQTAIPSIFPSRPTRKESAASRKRKLNQEIKARKKIIDEILKEHSNDTTECNNSVHITVTPTITQDGFDLQVKQEPPEIQVVEYEDFATTTTTDDNTNNNTNSNVVPDDTQDLTSVLNIQRSVIVQMEQVIQKQRTEIIRLTNISKLQKLVNKTKKKNTS